MLGIVVASLMLTCLSHIMGNLGSRYLFLIDWLWLGQTMGEIGGVSIYIASWVAQWAQYPVVGAVIIGVLFATTYLLLSRSCRSHDPLSLALIPVLYLFSGYLTSQFLLTVVAVVLNVALFSAWRTVRHEALALALIPPVLFIAYAGTSTAFVILAILISVDILLGKRLFAKNSLLVKIAIVAAIALWAWGVPWIGGLIYGLTSQAAYSILWADGCKIDTTLFLIVGAVAVVSNLPSPRSIEGRWWIAPASFIVIASIYATIFCHTFKDNVRQIMLVEQAADSEDWPSVIERADHIKGENHTVSYLRNVALFRQGQLVERIFDYPQPFGPMGLFIEWSESNNELQVKLADLVYANIGLVNEAHRLAFESINIGGQNSRSLARLVHYNRLMGREEIAHKFEQRLSRTMFYRPTTLSGGLVSSCPDSVYTATSNFAKNLDLLISHDSTNKAAVDYLAIYHLLSTDLNSFAALLPSIRSIYGDRLPRIYNEALLLDKAFNPQSKTNFSPDAPTVARFEQFNRAVQSQGLKGTYNDYHSTYWYYVACVMSNRSQR